MSQSRKSLMDLDVKYLITDEISRMTEHLYMFFITLKRIRPDIIFIMVGDFNQLKPVCDHTLENCDYGNSAALNELVDGNRLTLSNCRRSDDGLYNLCLPENIASVKNQTLDLRRR